MKQLFTILIASVILFSCKGKSSDIPPDSQSKIVAVWTKPDSTKELGIMLRQITVTMPYDSVAKKRRFVVDTFYGYPVPKPLVDSLGKVVLDSLTKQPILSPQPAYYYISKDSVNWRVEGIPVDQLLKK